MWHISLKSLKIVACTCDIVYAASFNMCCDNNNTRSSSGECSRYKEYKKVQRITAHMLKALQRSVVSCLPASEGE